MPDEEEPQIKVEGDDSVKAAPNNNTNGDNVVISDASIQGEGATVEKGTDPNSLKIKIELPTATPATPTEGKNNEPSGEISPTAIPAAAPEPNSVSGNDTEDTTKENDEPEEKPALDRAGAEESAIENPVESKPTETPAGNTTTEPATPTNNPAEKQPPVEPQAPPVSSDTTPTPEPTEPKPEVKPQTKEDKKPDEPVKPTDEQAPPIPDNQTPKINPEAEQGAASDLSSNRAKDTKAKTAEKPTPEVEKPTGGDTTEPEETPEDKKQRLTQEQADDKDEQRRQDKNQIKGDLNRTVAKPFSKIKSVRNRRQILSLTKEKNDLKKKIEDIDKEIKKLKKAHRKEVIKAIVAAFSGIGLVYGLFKALQLIMSDTKEKIQALEKDKKDLAKKTVKLDLKIYNLRNVFQLEEQREQQAEQTPMAEAA